MLSLTILALGLSALLPTITVANPVPPTDGAVITDITKITIRLPPLPTITEVPSSDDLYWIHPFPPPPKPTVTKAPSAIDPLLVPDLPVPIPQDVGIEVKGRDLAYSIPAM
jgi:hypothetical protein